MRLENKVVTQNKFLSNETRLVSDLNLVIRMLRERKPQTTNEYQVAAHMRLLYTGRSF